MPSTQLKPSVSPVKSVTRNFAQRIIAVPLSLTLLHVAPIVPAAVAAPAAETFQMKCAACHVNGGNVVGGPTLFPQDLKKNGVDTAEKIYEIIYSGKNIKMPGFGLECAPKGKCTFGTRLTDEEIKDLSEYVLERANANWK